MWFGVFLWGETGWRFAFTVRRRHITFHGGRLHLFLEFFEILEVFRSFSGLRVNLIKSTLQGINTEADLLQDLADLSGCKLGLWPIKYLGLPLGGNPQRIDFWDPVVTKVAKRLVGWKKAF